MTRLWFVVVMLACATAASAQTVGRTLSLDEAIAIAIAQNRALANATLAVDKAQQDIDAVKTRRLPGFNVEAQASELLKPVDITFAEGAFGTFPATGPIPNTDTTITTPRKLATVVNATVSQPITQLKAIGLRVRMTEVSAEMQREQVRAVRVALVADVKRLYYGVLQTTSAREAARAQTTQLMELDRVVTNRVEQRTALRGTSLEVRAKLAQSRLALVTVEHTLDSQKEQLNQLLGRDVRTPFEATGAISPSAFELDAEAAVSKALSNRPDIKQAQARLRQSELNRRLVRTDYIPEVSLAASYISPINIEGAPRNMATLGVQVKWEPFDWGRRAHAVASAALSTRQAKNAVDDAEQQAVLEITAAVRRLEEARLRIESAELAQDSANENTRVKLAQYVTDAALAADVLQSQAAFADAANQYQQALLGYFTARADFDRALGEDVTK